MVVGRLPCYWVSVTLQVLCSNPCSHKCPKMSWNHTDLDHWPSFFSLEPPKKTSYFPLHPGWLIGILIMVSFNPYIKLGMIIPLITQRTRIFFVAVFSPVTFNDFEVKLSCVQRAMTHRNFSYCWWKKSGQPNDMENIPLYYYIPFS